MTSEKRYCEDCRFHQAQKLNGDTFHLCHAPQNELKPDGGMALVTRNSPPNKNWMCETAWVQRETDNSDYCGREGRWFQPKIVEVAA